MERSAGIEGHLWAVVLAGGEGVRLRPLVRRLYGEARPKQFTALVGSRSLLRQVLDRVRLAVPSDHTLVVTLKHHDGYLADALDGAAVRRVMLQPEDKDTAAGVLFPVHWVHRRDPEAIVAVFPSDHFIRISDEHAFMEHVADMVDVIREHPGWTVLLGASPSDAEPDYGWIEPGEILAWSPSGEPVSRVRQFLEKPLPREAQLCLEKGWLWNTFVLVVKASRLLQIEADLLPEMHEALLEISRCDQDEIDPGALERAYVRLRKASFSRAILEPCPAGLVVSRLPAAVTWSDWGTPERVVKSLKKAGLLPRWFGESDLMGDLGKEGRQGREVRR
jgi:mannose-1-phosphate guanylyltransferase